MIECGEDDEDIDHSKNKRRHEAIIDVLVNYCGLMDMIEEDEDEKPLLRQIMEDEISAAEFLLDCVRST